MKSISTVYDCNIIPLPRIQSVKGNITPISELDNIPFTIERVYYLYDVPGGQERGGHAHKNLQQLIVAVSGSFDIILNDGVNKKRVMLNRPYEGLLMPSGIWRELTNFSSGAICLVLASAKYTENDYLRMYEDFLKFKQDSLAS